jgi:UDP:flavonoid glycosyltransferase YjiC (YdhE family)
LANLLISTQRLLGHLLPGIKLGVILKDKGHHVTMLGHNSNEEMIREAGLDFIEIGWDKVPNLYLYEFYSEIVSQIGNKKFDLFICDSTQCPPVYAAEKMKIPWVSFQTTLPLPEEYMPGRERVNRRLRFDYMNKLNLLRNKIGLPLLDSESYRTRGDLVGLSSDLHLIMVYPELIDEQIAVYFPPNSHVVGNINFQKDTLSFEIKQALETHKTKILVCTSSIPRLEYRETMNRYIETAIHLFSEDPSVQLFISDTQVWWGEKLPLNVKWIQETPIHEQLIPLVDIVITHGGCGTLQNIIKNGKPMVIIPLGGDHEILGDKCKRLGIADLIYPQYLSSTELSNAIKRVMGNLASPLSLMEKTSRYQPEIKSAELIENIMLR